jgi:diguanylate cyclase (GGDEF)-like protein/PAS domain S-box-containing protein
MPDPTPHLEIPAQDADADERRALLHMFVTEAQERLADMEGALGGLGTQPESEELAQRLFRGAHTLKGGASCLGFSRLAALAGDVEELLRRVLKRACAIDGELVALLRQSVDALRHALSDAVAGVDDAPVSHADLQRRLAAATRSTPEISLPAVVTPPRPADEGARARILVVEDDATIAALERQRLERAGYAVTTCATADHALMLMQSSGADLIILDYTLPHGVSGLDCYAALKGAGHDVPVIMVTGLSDEATIVEALRAGVRDFVTKSLQYLEYLPEAVERVLAQERTRKALATSREDLKRSASLLRATLEATADGLLTIDRNGKITSFNTRFAEMWGIPRTVLDEKDDERAIACVLEQLKDPDEFVAKIKALYADPLASSFDALEFKDGKVFERLSQPQMLDGCPVGRVWSFRDVTQQRRAAEQLHYLAHRDALTDLPNRTLLHDRLSQALVQAHRAQTFVALMFLDLDRFKAVNDTLGHVVGDLLIRAVAERLLKCVRETDTVARFGGDEFTILLTNVAQAQDAALVARKILEALSHPFHLGGPELFVTTSIGITIYPTDDESVDGLFKNADAAMYRAKEQGRNTYHFYTGELNTKSLDRLTLENDLRHALARNEFVAHYQPQIDLTTGRISGTEALLRWRHPSLGLVSPNRFIPIAEDTGLIGPIGEWILRAACTQSQAWQTAGLAPIRMSVNLSGRQLEDPRFIDTVGRVLRETGLRPDTLDLELTESVIMRNAQSTISTLQDLNRIGVRFSIDDFGTGYSSLSYLKRFPVHVLKIDPSFVRDVTTDPADAAIVQAIIALAHALHLKVIAEGVERPEQLAWLRANGCDEMQGHLFSRAVPADVCTQFLQSGRSLSFETLPDLSRPAA